MLVNYRGVIGTQVWWPWGLYFNCNTPLFMHCFPSLINDLQSLPRATCPEPGEKYRTHQAIMRVTISVMIREVQGDMEHSKRDINSVRGPGVLSKRKWHWCSQNGEGESARENWVGTPWEEKNWMHLLSTLQKTHSVTMLIFPPLFLLMWNLLQE